MRFASIFVVLLLLIGGGTYWYLSSKKTEELPVQEIEQDIMAPLETDQDISEVSQIVIEENAAGTEGEQEAVLPSLDESTSWVMNATKEMLSHPVFESFFNQKEVVRKFVVAIDRLGRGENPYKQMSYLHPSGKFEVETEADVIALSRENFRRFSPLVLALEALPQAQIMVLYEQMEPFFIEAYHELGNGDSWDEALKRAFGLVESFSYPQEPVELLGSKGGYIFRDNNLEQASWVQKLLVRVGPEQSGKLRKLIKSYFSEWEEHFSKKKIDKETVLE